jgi:hypothetical protein
MHFPRPPNRSESAVTRVQAIVTLAVLGVLFSIAFALLYPAVKMVRASRLSAEAGTMVKNIANACRFYADENGGFPPIAAARDGQEGNRYLSFGDTTEGRCKVNNSELFNALRGISAGSNSGDVLNQWKTNYFTGPVAAGHEPPRNGFADGSKFPEALRGRLFDPWGAEYCVLLDDDKDGRINVGAFYQDFARPEETVQNSAVAFSMGEDRKRGGEEYEGFFKKPFSDRAPDDFISWQ